MNGVELKKIQEKSNSFVIGPKAWQYSPGFLESD